MNIFEKLTDYAKMESLEDIGKFEELVWRLVQSQDTDIIRKLILIFDDECPYFEVMYTLLHAIETYPNEIYVDTVIDSYPTLLEKAPLWLDRIINRILNEDECKLIFINSLEKANKNNLHKLFNLIECESPHHKSLIDDLRQKFLDQQF